MRLQGDRRHFLAHDKDSREPFKIETLGARLFEHGERHKQLAGEHVRFALARIASSVDRESRRMVDIDWFAEHEAHTMEQFEVADLVGEREPLPMRMLTSIHERVALTRVLAAVRAHGRPEIRLVVRDAEMRDHHPQVNRRLPDIARP